VRTRATGRRCGRPRANAAFHATLEDEAQEAVDEDEDDDL